MKGKIGHLISAALLVSSSQAMATTYPIPPKNQSIIGEEQIGYVRSGDPVANLAKTYDVGFNELQNANPDTNLDGKIYFSKKLTIPTEHLLPDIDRKGIVVNLPEMRMYFYKGDEVVTYPIGIGKTGNTIPIKSAKITYKKTNPYWYPPQDIREFNLKRGIILPRVFPPGPDNPLGKYAVYMTIPTYLFHSTIFPESVGRRASFGCIRMYEEDIADLFPSIKHGIPLEIINQPVKLGWQNKDLYMEAHQPLEEHAKEDNVKMKNIVHRIVDKTKNKPVFIDWQKVDYITKVKDGRPHSIGSIIK